jgi:hypothetical protein
MAASAGTRSWYCRAQLLRLLLLLVLVLVLVLVPGVALSAWVPTARWRRRRLVAHHHNHQRRGSCRFRVVVHLPLVHEGLGLGLGLEVLLVQAGGLGVVVRVARQTRSRR